MVKPHRRLWVDSRLFQRKKSTDFPIVVTRADILFLIAVAAEEAEGMVTDKAALDWRLIHSR